MTRITEQPFSRCELAYELPKSLIAQRPLPRRDASRMLVLDRATGRVGDGRITDLRDWLRPGDLLVLNDTKVLPARFVARRVTGGRVAGLFLREEQLGRWRVMLEGSRRLRVNEVLSTTVASAGETSDPPTPALYAQGQGSLGADEHPAAVARLSAAQFTLAERCGPGVWIVDVDPKTPAERLLDRIGSAPLPPYIRRDDPAAPADHDDRVRYQTVYARRSGAVAAPTAGLHLTEGLLGALHACNVETTFVTLHVGAGTFKPIEAENLAEHEMHAEWFEISSEAAEAVRRCRDRNSRVVAVGTTSARVLESAAATDASLIRAACGWTDLFIFPPYSFRVVDGLLTNFHLPNSTLLALVMAFAGVEAVRCAYAHAMEQQYRFYSYGDAMLIV